MTDTQDNLAETQKTTTNDTHAHDARGAHDEHEPEHRILVLHDFCTRKNGSDCERCLYACPMDALSVGDENIPVIDEGTCTGCSICMGICDAFTSNRVTMIDLHARIRRIALRGDRVVITCKENIFPGFSPASNVVVLPCIATLPPELWTLALAENIPLSVAADLSYCTDCERATDRGVMLFSHAIEVAQDWTGREVRYQREIPEKENIVKEFANPNGVDRRAAFTNAAIDVADIVTGKRRLRNSEVLQEFYERRERARARARLNLNDSSIINNFVPEGHTRQIMHPKRQMLLEAIDRLPSIAQHILLNISETDCSVCTNEHACLNVCPTKARTPHPETGKLEFDERYCIGCGLCVDACPKGAVALIETTAEIFLPKAAKESKKEISDDTE